MADFALGWLVPACAGAIAALVYFAGLWWTVQRVRDVRHPVAFLAASFVVRAGLAVGALWLVVQGDVWRVLVALGAFLIVRGVVVWRVSPPPRDGRAGARG